MFLNPNEAVNRLGSERNVAGKLVEEVVREARGVKIIDKNGRGWSSETPNILKPIIASVTLSTSTRKAEEIFDTNRNSNSQYARGNYGKKAEADGIGAIAKQVVETLDQELTPIRKLAMEKITRTMGNITDNKLEDNSAKTLSEIARNLSSVIRNSTPQKQDKDDGAKYNFNIFAPRVRDMSMYETLELGAAVEEVG